VVSFTLEERANGGLGGFQSRSGRIVEHFTCSFRQSKTVLYVVQAVVYLLYRLSYPAAQFHNEPRTSIECSSEAINANPLSYRIKLQKSVSGTRHNSKINFYFDAEQTCNGTKLCSCITPRHEDDLLLGVGTNS